MKRLNNKGFTLVELLAVVVILALVMGIAASSMLGVMNNSRTSTLYSAAQTAASNLNNWVVEDMLATSTAQQVVGNDFISYTQAENPNTWICLNNTEIAKIVNKNSKGQAKTSLLTALGLNTTDLVIVKGGTPPTKDATTKKYVITNTGTTKTAGSTCSALRYNASTGGYEFFLNAKSGGKYFVASDTDHYAFSRATAANTLLSD